MNEIEIKARVADRIELEKKLNSFAQFSGSVSRDDSYWANTEVSKKKIRIRKETTGSGSNCTTQWLITYKIKDNVLSPEGITTEVNQELETVIENPEPLLRYFKDTGYSEVLSKHKEVSDWKYEDATLELCHVPPLGWFLEIEILAENNSPATVDSAQKKLKELLYKCGLNDSDIEEKYYSQLLREYKSKGMGENNV